MQRIVTFKMPDDMLERLDAYAARRGMARSEVIREAIIALLAREFPPLRAEKQVAVYKGGLK